jgi:hypothetical protein
MYYYRLQINWVFLTKKKNEHNNTLPRNYTRATTTKNKAVSSAGFRPKSDCSGKAQKQLYSKLQTCPLVREDATKLQTCNGLN